MAQSVLLWSSYLMIVAVVLLGFNGMQLSKSVTKRVGHSVFAMLIPVIPVVLYVFLYMLVGYPGTLSLLTTLELTLFKIALESVAAGSSVIVFIWLIMLFNAGLARVVRKIRSRYLRWH